MEVIITLAGTVLIATILFAVIQFSGRKHTEFAGADL